MTKHAATRNFTNHVYSLGSLIYSTIHQQYFLQFLCHFGVTHILSNHSEQCSLLFEFFLLATTFLELWKRKQSVIKWEWDLQNIESDEENRPEFETSVKTFRTNPVTREKEPYMPTWTRAVRYIGTGSAVLFMVVLT